MRMLMTVITIFFAMASSVAAQIDEKILGETRSIAAESLKSYHQLVIKQKNYREMGFESPEELGKMTLGEPLQVFMVRLDHLQTYKTGSDPNKLLSGGNQLIYPVLANNQLRSSITVVPTNGGWKAVSFGSPNKVRLISKARLGNAEATRIPLASHFVVEIPAFNLAFIGYRVEGTLMLTPIRDDAGFGFKADVSMPADKVFTVMLPAAKAHNGMPR